MLNSHDSIPLASLLTMVLPGSIIVLVALIMKRWPPKWPNTWYGYRTPLSCSSEFLFTAGNQKSSKAMLRNGMIIVSLGLLFMFIEASATIAMLETGLAVALILASII
jgi:hypothetical protein